VRFFIDEGYFLEGDTEVLRAHIAGSGGRMVVGGESSAAFLSVKVCWWGLGGCARSDSCGCCPHGHAQPQAQARPPYPHTHTRARTML
jgi:hypothetical protein